MLYTISPIFQAESHLAYSGSGIVYGNAYSSSQSSFTPWENLEPFFISPSHKPNQNQGVNKSKPKPNQSRNHISLGLDLDDANQKSLDSDETSGHESPTQTSSGSVDLDQNYGCSNSSSGQENKSTQTTSVDERKRKRMVSNRDSARRSRQRKQIHEENLRKKANHLKLENQEGTKRLLLMANNIHHARSDNDRLRAESVILQSRLIELGQLWQLHRNNNHDQHDSLPRMLNQIIRPNNEQIIIP